MGAKWLRVGLISLFLIPLVLGSPEIREESQSVESFIGSDYVWVGSNLGQEVSFRITSPNGVQWSVRGVPATSTVTSGCGSGVPVSSLANLVVRIDGTVLHGSDVVTSGAVDGEPSDGTISITYSAVGLSFPKTEICVGGKGYSNSPTGTAACSSCLGFTHSVLWNRHETTNFYADTNAAEQGINVEENPDNFRFFRPDAQEPPRPTDGDPRAFTTQSGVSCPSSLTVNGLWSRGTTQSLNTFARFAVIDGQPDFNDATPTDIRDNPGATLTPLVDDGAGPNGDHAATVPYNNAIGNSYQFFVRNGSAGLEQFLGSVLFVAPGQCVPQPNPALSGTTFDEHRFDLTVSHSQCASDPVSFTVNIGVVNVLVDLDVSIIDSQTNVVVLTVDDSQMFHRATGIAMEGFFFFNRTLGDGPWVGVATGDFGGLGALDFFDTEGFNVPLGICLGTGGINNIVNTINNNVFNSFNDTFNSFGGVIINNFTTNLNQTEANITAAIGADQMRFEQMTTSESWSFLFFFLIMAWALWQGLPRIAVMSVIGGIMFLVSSTTDDLLGDGQEWFGDVTFIFSGMLVFIGFWLETLSKGWSGIKGK